MPLLASLMGQFGTGGLNNHGQLGDGTTTQRSTAVQVTSLTGFVAVAAGQYHTLAVRSDGAAWAWGYNNNGQLADGTTTERHIPVQVMTTPQFILTGGTSV